jgi:hypothetical protein
MRYGGPCNPLIGQAGLLLLDDAAVSYKMYGFGDPAFGEDCRAIY